MKALVVATTLAIPFATYSTPALAALKVEANQSVAQRVIARMILRLKYIYQKR